MVRLSVPLIAIIMMIQAAGPTLAGSKFNPSRNPLPMAKEDRINQDAVRRIVCPDLAVKIESYS